MSKTRRTRSHSPKGSSRRSSGRRTRSHGAKPASRRKSVRNSGHRPPPGPPPFKKINTSLEKLRLQHFKVPRAEGREIHKFPLPFAVKNPIRPSLTTPLFDEKRCDINWKPNWDSGPKNK